MKYKNVQKNFTISEEQRKFVESNHGKMNIGQLSKMLGLTYNKTHNNLRLMGLVKNKKQGKLVSMETFFDVDKFGQNYSY